MPSNPSFHYDTIATAFQVVDIAQPLRTSAPPDWSLEDVWAAILEDTAEFADNWFALIRDEQKILGYVAPDSIPDTGDEAADDPKHLRAGDICTLITPDQIVAADLSLLDLIPLFEQRPFFFVLTGNDLTHVVLFRALDQLPVKLCLFALVIGLEAECLRLFSVRPQDIERHLGRLPAGRYQKALDQCRARHSPKKILPEHILQATQFIDKATMLLRAPTLLSALPFNSKDAGKKFFNELKNLRNRIAHSDSILGELPTAQAFNRLLNKLKDLTEAVTQLAQRSADDDDLGPPAPA